MNNRIVLVMAQEEGSDSWTTQLSNEVEQTKEIFDSCRSFNDGKSGRIMMVDIDLSDEENPTSKVYLKKIPN